MRGAQDADGLRHEMDTAENDVTGLREGSGFPGEEERVSLEVGVFDNLLSLVVVPQDSYRLAQFSPDQVDTLVQLLGR